MPENNNHIKQYTAADIQRYLSRQMPAAERHAMEKAALEDPFLAEAMEGYAQRPATGIVPDIEDLKKRLQQRTGRRKTASLYSRRIWWSAAASVLIVLGGAFTWYWLSPAGNHIAQKKETAVAPVTESRDTAKAPAAADNVVKESREEKSTPLSPVPEKAPSAAPPPPPQRTKQASPPESHTKDDTAAPPPGFNSADRVATVKAVEQAQAIEVLENEKSQTAEPRNIPVSAAQNEAPAPAHINTITGKITDHNNIPLPFVNIRPGDTALETYSDARGNFKLISGKNSLAASLRSVGFQPKEVVLYAGVPVNTVVLQPDTGQLREVVASAYGIQKKRALSANDSKSAGEAPGAVPADGWKNYDIYLMNNTRSPGRGSTPVHGLVDVSFIVNQYGQLSDFKILHSTCLQCNPEAVRVIKEGPRWKLTGNTDTAKMTITVRF
jgi:hypothetical protein